MAGIADNIDISGSHTHTCVMPWLDLKHPEFPWQDLRQIAAQLYTHSKIYGVLLGAFCINPLWGHCQEYKNEKKSNPTTASFIRKKKRFCLLQPYLVWKFLSHWSRKTSPKVRGTLKSLPKVVSKRGHQEECVQSAKTARSVASCACVASQVLQVTDKLPSFPRKAEFSQIER